MRSSVGLRTLPETRAHVWIADGSDQHAPASMIVERMIAPLANRAKGYRLTRVGHALT